MRTNYFNTICILTLCLATSMGLFAQNSPTPLNLSRQVGTGRVSGGGAQHEVSNTERSEVKKYTFGDFFDALDLPTVLGAGFRPDGIESASFNAGLRLGWRHHKNYGAFVYLSYNPYSATYDSLCVANTNVRSGENWFHEVSIGVGYRVPLVRDIRGFYQNPYFD